MARLSPFLPGNCLFSLGWPTTQNHLRSRPMGTRVRIGLSRGRARKGGQGQSRRVQAASEAIDHQGVQEPQGRASWDPGMEDPDMTQPSSQHPHSVSKSAWQLSNYSLA